MPSILNAPLDSTTGALAALSDLSRNFEEKYRRAVESCRRLNLPLTVCTIYNGCFPDAQYQRLISTALTVFNDVILRVAIELSLSVIDVRFVCICSSDYANPLEPSSMGGAKIACAMIDLYQDIRKRKRHTSSHRGVPRAEGNQPARGFSDKVSRCAPTGRCRPVS